jgi:predicted transglutaminase-like cysteine proteinase
MFEKHRARRAAAVAFCFGFLLCTASAAARESGAPSIGKAPAPFMIPDVQTASVSPFNALFPGRIVRGAEPFDLEASAPVTGTIQHKWTGIKQKLPRESRSLAICRANGDACTSAAKRFLAIIDKAAAREGWTRIAEINRAINLSIKPIDDMTQYGVRDRWASPLMTFASGAGDCEDYAIAKYVALREIGFEDNDLRLVIVHNHAASEDHAVAAVRHENRWLILDNKTLEIRRDDNIAHFDPLFVVDSGGVRRAEARAPNPEHGWADARIMGDKISGRQERLLTLWRKDRPKDPHVAQNEFSSTSGQKQPFGAQFVYGAAQGMHFGHVMNFFGNKNSPSARSIFVRRMSEGMWDGLF